MTAVTTDTTTQGNWQGVYGAAGWTVSQDPSLNNPSIPGFATLGITGQTNYLWNGSTTDVRAAPRGFSRATPARST